MVAVLAELGPARLGDIPGLTAVGAAAILAETRRSPPLRQLLLAVKHAVLSPSDNASGAFWGQAHISRRGRPSLRLTVWRVRWAVLIHNPVMTAKYQAGYAYVVLDGTLIPIDRVAADRPFYSGKHRKHGMNLQVIASPDGGILWVSGALSGSVHDKEPDWIWGVLAELDTVGLVTLAH